VSHRFITQLQEGELLKQFFLLRRVEHRRTRDGKPFLDLVLADRTGTLKARVWEEALRRCPTPLAECDFVAVRGRVETYQGALQATLDFIDTVAHLRSLGRALADFDPEHLIPAFPGNREELWQELTVLAAAHLSEPLGPLVTALLERYKEQLLAWPGAEFLHHAYLGGLLEHTLTVARLALAVAEIYPQVNRELVLAGAILHDLGKIKELTEPPCPRRTPAGGLLGHIVLGWDMIRELARELKFPDEELLLQLEHLIIAHHGSEEFGSPVLPKTPEALLVYYLDELDAKLHMARSHLEADAGEGDFTSWHKTLARRLYKGAAAGTPLPLTPAPEEEGE
jgi:3'-5' exoribonuclease